MKYFITLFALLAFASCDTERSYRCDCTSNKGHILYTYDADHKEAKDGVPACEAVEDSIIASFPDAGVQCYFFRIEN